MRRQEIIDGALQVAAALREAEIEDVLVGRPEGGKTVNVVESFRRYSTAALHFNPAARNIAETLGLKPLEEAAFWSAVIEGMLKRDGPGSGTVRRIYLAIQFATVTLPKFLRLIRPESADLASEIEKEHGGLLGITVILPEGEKQYSKPQRLTEILTSVTELYDALALINNEKEGKLVVVGCDSGSDKSFDFLGVAQVVQAVKELLLDLWDRVIFYREKKLAQCLELIGSSLPIIDKIGELEVAEKIEREQAEILRRKILGGVNKFLSCGATIPEMEERSQFHARQLMAPEPRLLSAGPATPPVRDSSKLTEEEESLLEELQRKKSGSHSSKESDDESIQGTAD